MPDARLQKTREAYKSAVPLEPGTYSFDVNGTRLQLVIGPWIPEFVQEWVASHDWEKVK